MSRYSFLMVALFWGALFLAGQSIALSTPLYSTFGFTQHLVGGWFNTSFGEEQALQSELDRLALWLKKGERTSFYAHLESHFFGEEAKRILDAMLHDPRFVVLLGESQFTAWAASANYGGASWLGRIEGRMDALDTALLALQNEMALWQKGLQALRHLMAQTLVHSAIFFMLTLMATAALILTRLFSPAVAAFFSWVVTSLIWQEAYSLLNPLFIEAAGIDSLSKGSLSFKLEAALGWAAVPFYVALFWLVLWGGARLFRRFGSDRSKKRNSV